MYLVRTWVLIRKPTLSRSQRQRPEVLRGHVLRLLDPQRHLLPGVESDVAPPHAEVIPRPVDGKTKRRTTFQRLRRVDESPGAVGAVQPEDGLVTVAAAGDLSRLGFDDVQDVDDVSVVARILLRIGLDFGSMLTTARRVLLVGF